MRLSRLLLISSILCYIGFDIFSTLAAYVYLGTFEYERSTLIRGAFDLAGVPGFILIKVIISLIAITAAFWLMERYEQFRGLGAGVLGGATAAGLFVGTSNINILYQGCSIWVFGLDSGTIATIIICGCSLIGLLSSGMVLWKPRPIKVN